MSTGIRGAGLEPRPLLVPAWKLRDGAYLKATLKATWKMPGLSQTPSHRPWSPGASGDSLWSREDNALSPTDSWGFRRSPSLFFQVAGKFPTTPPDHIAGNSKHLVAGDAKYAGRIPQRHRQHKESVPTALT